METGGVAGHDQVERRMLSAGNLHIIFGVTAQQSCYYSEKWAIHGDDAKLRQTTLNGRMCLGDPDLAARDVEDVGQLSPTFAIG